MVVKISTAARDILNRGEPTVLEAYDRFRTSPGQNLTLVNRLTGKKFQVLDVDSQYTARLRAVGEKFQFDSRYMKLIEAQYRPVWGVL